MVQPRKKSYGDGLKPQAKKCLLLAIYYIQWNLSKPAAKMFWPWYADGYFTQLD